MNFISVLFLICFSSLLLNSCKDEKWTCKIDTDQKNLSDINHVGKMYSLSESGKRGGAEKGCSCLQIRTFELKNYSGITEKLLKEEFGC